MAVYSCPKGHSSLEEDFCSECGAKITGANTGGNSSASAPMLCPDCKAPRAHDAGEFCEVCGYNFRTAAHGDVAFAQATAFSQAAAPAQASMPAPVALEIPVQAEAAPPSKWSLIASVDPTLREEGSPEAPERAPFALAIEKGENLIGRNSRARGIEPEIALDFDDAVSHRHAIVSRLEDGSLAVRDIGSANGTRLNGQDLPPLTDTALKDGDALTLGHWTRLVVKASE
jgi:hypothetical protein